MSFLLVGINLWWFVYMALLPPEKFHTDRIWRGVLEISPLHDPRIFAGGFLITALVVSWSHFWVRSIGLLLGMVTWAALGGSHLWAAAHNGWLGAGGAGLAFFVLGMHALVLRWRRRQTPPRVG